MAKNKGLHEQDSDRRMITLFLDGFRGFEKVELALQDVNFLVGENSSGKTSLLAAMEFLGSAQIWQTGLLQSSYVDLGKFEDLSRPSRTFFQIGFEADRAGAPRRLRLTFVAGKGAPELAGVDFQVDLQTAARGMRIVRTGEGFFLGPAPSDQEGEPLETTGLKRLAPDRGPAHLAQFARSVLALPAEIPDNRDINETMAQAVASLRPESLTPFQAAAVWVAPIRAKPRRSYDRYLGDYSNEGEHLPQLLEVMQRQEPSPGSPTPELAQFGRTSGLFRSVEVHHFGSTDERAPAEIRVELDELSAPILNVGYGVSQALPVAAEVIARPPGTWFGIQQPEVHLHPRAQAAMGDLFFAMARAPHGKRFIVETHSDYVVDRFRAAMRTASREGKAVPSAQVIFLQRDGANNSVHPLTLSPAGEYPSEQPPGFREFFLQEELRNLGY